MPVFLWGDKDYKRYRESYFDEFPGVWRQGDFCRINERLGGFVLGRSDATLNRHGIRIGTAEIYRTLALLPEIEDSLIVNLDIAGGNFFMPLFVKLRAGQTLDAALLSLECLGFLQELVDHDPQVIAVELARARCRRPRAGVVC